jgi:circadian clock protein KaiB
MAEKLETLYHLRLYVYGKSERSESAIRSVQQICTTHLLNENHLEIIDLAETPGAGQEDCILATPTLIRKKPAPEYRIIGDLSETAKVLSSLGITSG